MDRGVGTGFEAIAHMLLEQKKMMDGLENENRELRRQLADLRRGVGISLLIEGKTVTLGLEPSLPVTAEVRQVPSPPPSQPSETAAKLLLGGEGKNGQSKDSRGGGTPLADSFVL